ncbi:hypothetical protein [Lactobacillus helsingborgensis]|uniref:hypothetical protein n=1 Tax=Lactobacillus helsingborgensis TaxID=1218494 RepID=UPI0036F2B4C9
MFFSLKGKISLYFLPIISGGTFTYSHYLNRWSKKMYTLKSYIRLFVLGTTLMFIFQITKCISITIFLHWLYNFPAVLSPVVQCFLHRNDNNHMFNDYN